MSLLTLTNLCIAYGDNKLLDQANLTLEPGQRIGLIGRNGEGKTTLLNIINSAISADDGEIRLKPGTTIATLEQSPSLNEATTVFELVASGIGEVGHLLGEYHRLSQQSDPRLDLLGELQHKLDSCDGWNIQARVDKTLSRLNLNADDNVGGLSGGWQRRVSLARALASDPQILLFDEPTNHLDLETIIWLEKQTRKFTGGILFITHDREFLQNVATDIAELDRGKLVIWPGNYNDYLKRKAAALEQEQRQYSEFDKKLAKEEVWIRQGIKARRTRNEGRVRALEKMRLERMERRNRKSNVNLELEQGKQSGKLVIEASNICFSYEKIIVVKDFSCRIIRKDRIGLIGPNGIGKSTLLKLLLDGLQPHSGTVKHGTKIEVAYFDQLREHLNLESTVIDTIGQGREQIEINGRTRHVISYLSDFLFSPARSRSPIKSLSGGEKARVLLARLFSKPANLLVMDEPTNDLDIETLELLEELLLQFEGTLLLVSHDRKFLDNVVTSTFSFQGNGVISEQVGGYSDWLRMSEAKAVTQKRGKSKSSPTITTELTAPSRTSKTKLSYKEQHELDSLPKQIEEIESKQDQLTQLISDTNFYDRPKADIDNTLKQLKSVSDQLEQLYQRWGELES